MAHLNDTIVHGLLDVTEQIVLTSKKYNVAKTAIARELACFVWGIMTDHIDLCS